MTFWITLTLIGIANIFIIHNMKKQERLKDEFCLVGKPAWLVQMADTNNERRFEI